MISIVILDDDAIKINNIRKAILEVPDLKESDIEVASDIKSARRIISERQFDLLILDLSIPEKFGDFPDSDGGANFLEEINLDQDYMLPYHILGLTAYNDLQKKYATKFEGYLWQLIVYDPEYDDWKNKVITHLKYLAKSKKEIENPSNVKYDFDIAIITALNKIELENVLKLNANWNEYKRPNDHTIYYKGVFEQGKKRLSVIAASADQMGLTATSVLSQKVISLFRPRYLFMTGIAMGIRHKSNFGDILIADLTWDYGNGKITTDEKGNQIFKPDPRMIPIAPELNALIKQEERDGSLLATIAEQWHFVTGKDSPIQLNLKYGPIASGSYVLENLEKVGEVIFQQRKLIGIDMEAYAVFYSAYNSTKPRPHAMVVKSVSDFGDLDKSDDYQDYAAFTSANFLQGFALKYL